MIWGNLSELDTLMLYESVFFIGIVLTGGGLFLLIGLGSTTGNSVRLGVHIGLVFLIPTIILGIYLGVNHFRMLFTLSLIFALASLGIGLILAYYLQKSPLIMEQIQGI